jgi:3-oxoacyl-[acyl-carrier-protein] synthase I
MKQTLYISNFSLINALGNENTKILANLIKGSQAGLSLRKDLLLDGDIVVADVSTPLPSLEQKPKHLNTRNNQLAMAALTPLKPEVNQLIESYGSDRVAIVVGTSTSGISEGESAMFALQQNNAFPPHYDYRQQEIYNIAEFVAQELATSGIALTISTACSSSAKAFKTAAELIESGMADAVIVGGVDSICGMTINGFHALDSTSANICQPSSINRDGINIGEAAALAIVRKDKGKIKLLGVGESSDAHHMSAPHPEGHGAITAMTKALEAANFKPEQVDYVNLHGTATPKNDAMESHAVFKVFGGETPVSSSKGMIGHTLGAAGATEVGICWLLLNDELNQEHYYAPQVWDSEIDPELAPLNIVARGHKKSSPLKACLSNSFAFGGNNVSVLIGV